MKRWITYFGLPGVLKFGGLLLIILCFSISVIAQNESVNQFDDNNQKSGFWVIEYREGGIMEKGVYVEGSKHGVWKAWYPDGTLKHEITYDRGVARGEARMYYRNGKLREAGTWNEVFWVGDYRYYYPNGQAAYLWQYNGNGRREGEQQYFYPNGEMKYQGKWADGKVDGHVEVYDSTGLMVQIRNYDGGQFSSSSTVNRKAVDGHSEHVLQPFEGTGYHTSYRMSGEVYQKGYFEEGKLISGSEFVYDDNNQLRQMRIYESGRLVRVRSGTELEQVTGLDR